MLWLPGTKALGKRPRKNRSKAHQPALTKRPVIASIYITKSQTGLLKKYRCMYTKMRDIFQDKHVHYRSIMEMHSAGEGETDRRQADKQGAARQTNYGHRTGKERNRKTNIRQTDRQRTKRQQADIDRPTDTKSKHRAGGQTNSRQADRTRTQKL